MRRRITAVFLLFALCITFIFFLSSCGAAEGPEPEAPPAAEPKLTVTFLDVGQGDAALVECDGAAMLIDGGAPGQSSKLYSALKRRGITRLDYLVATHPDADHIGGLAGALEAATVGTAYCSVAEHDTDTFRTFQRKLEEKGVPLAVPEAGDSFPLGGSTVQLLGPLRQSGDTNNSSLVLRLVCGETALLFTGDAEREEEQDLLTAGCDLSATLLKVGHHGSDSSTSYPFLREVMPRYAVLSVGADNPYGHPDENTLSRLRDAGVQVFRTDLQGDITVTGDGHTLTVTPARNADAQTNPTAPAAGGDAEPSEGDSAQTPSSQPPSERPPDAPGRQPETPPSSPPRQSETPSAPAGGPEAPAAPSGGYIGNRSTKKFHLPSCPSLPAEKNRVPLATREQALERGFSPCGRCNP